MIEGLSPRIFPQLSILRRSKGDSSGEIGSVTSSVTREFDLFLLAGEWRMILTSSEPREPVLIPSAEYFKFLF